MRFFLLLPICVFAIFFNACERQPLPGDPPPGEEHEVHGAESPGVKATGHGEAPRSEEAAKGEEAPKFFPEKK
jgi:hypothetical protein